jgi:hypothetical protein
MSDNPFAFPVSGDETPWQNGMELRDWFAGRCDISVYSPLASFELANKRKATISEMAAYIAEIRFIEADAMLAARKKGLPDD